MGIIKLTVLVVLLEFRCIIDNNVVVFGVLLFYCILRSCTPILIISNKHICLTFLAYQYLQQ